MSTFQQIRNLARDLIEESSVLKRRKAGEQLSLMVGDANVISRLVSEATNTAESRVNPRPVIHKALSDLWRFIIRNAVQAVQLICKKNKAVKADFIMLRKLVQASGNVHGDDTSYSTYFYTRPDPYLSRKEIRSVFKFCMKLLDDDNALDVAEEELLSLLGTICARSDFVTNLKIYPDMMIILEEVESRIITSEDTEIDTTQPTRLECTSLAVTIFYNLIKTTTAENMNLNLLFPNCIKMIARWCAEQYTETVDTAKLSGLPLISGLALLIKSDPHQAMMPLHRHGLSILKFVQYCYRVVTTASAQNSLNEYLISHLIVAEIAGRVDGYLPGDLGNLGPASLTLTYIRSLLSVVCTPDRALDLLRRKEHFEWPLSEVSKRHMELCARLLAVGQRQYISTAEAKLVEDPVALLEESIAEPFMNDTPEWVIVNKKLCPEIPDCDTDALSASPIVTYVVSPLILSIREESLPKSSQYPILEVINKMESKFASNSLRTARTITLLQILCACTEQFPSGCCWNMHGLSSWKDTGPNTESLSCRSKLIRCCSVEDLGLVINTVCLVLEVHGQPQGSPEVQRWALVCLFHLAYCTLVVQRLQGESDKKDVLVREWRSVWSILFRQELRYYKQCDNNESGSIGWLVCQLISQVINFHCLDHHKGLYSEDSIRESFLCQAQSKLWQMSVFTDSTFIKSSAPFEMLFSFIRCMPVWSGVNDDNTASRMTQADKAVSNTKYRILALCFDVLEHKNQVLECSGVIEACIIGIIHGVDSLLCDKYNDVYSNDYPFHTDSWYGNDFFSCTTQLDHSIPCVYSYLKRTSYIFRTMWLDNTFRLPYAGSPSLLAELDPVSYTRSAVLRDTINYESHPRSFKSDHNDSSLLFDKALQCCNQEIVPTNYMELLRYIQLSRLNVCVLHFADNATRSQSVISRVYENAYSCIQTLLSHQTLWTESESQLCRVSYSLYRLYNGLSSLSYRLESALPIGMASITTDLTALLSSILSVRSTSSLNVRYVANEGTSLSSDEDTDIEDSDKRMQNARRKRQHSDNQNRSRTSRRKISDSSPIVCSLDTAFIISILLVYTKPFSETLSIVTQALAQQDVLQQEISDTTDKSDILACYTICTSSELLFLHGDVWESHIMALDKLLGAVQCFNFDPHTSIFMFSSIYRISSFSHRFCLASTSALIDVVVHAHEAILQDKRWYTDYMFRSSTLQVASDFLSVLDHDLQGRIYPIFLDKFLSPSICHVHCSVRAVSAHAIDVALKLLPEKVVFKVIENYYPPLLANKTKTDKASLYRSWYNERNIGSGESNKLADDQIWEDLLSSLTYSIVLYYAMLAKKSASTKSVYKVFASIFHSLSTEDISNSLYLRFVHASTKGDGLTCFKSVEFWMEWIGNSDRLQNVSLAILEPQIALWTCKLGLEANPMSTVDYKSLHKMALQNFLVVNCKYLFPAILSSIIHTDKEYDGKPIELLDTFYRSNYIGEVATILDADLSDRLFRKLVKSTLPEFLAFCAILQCGSEEDQHTASIISKVVLEPLCQTDVLTKHAARSVNYFLFLCGTKHRGGYSALDTNRFGLGLEYCLERICSQRCSDDKYPFEKAGLLPTELLLLAKFQLEKNYHSTHTQGWFVVDVILDYLLEKIQSGYSCDLSLFVQVFCSIIASTSLSSYKQLAIRTLARFFMKIVESSNISDNQFWAEQTMQVVRLVFRYHEATQMDIWSYVTICQKVYFRLRRGISSFDKSIRDKLLPDLVMLNVNSYKKYHDGLVDSYNLLSCMLRNHSMFNLNSDAFFYHTTPSVIPVRYRKILTEINSSLCIQQLKFNEPENTTDEMSQGMKLLNPDSCRHQYNRVQCDLHLLHEQLKHGVEGRSTINSTLLQHLLTYSSNDYPESVKNSACECLGLIDLNRIASGSSQDGNYEVTSRTRTISVQVDIPLMDSLCIQSIDVLIMATYDTCTYTSLCLLETVKSLLQHFKHSDFKHQLCYKHGSILRDILNASRFHTQRLTNGLKEQTQLVSKTKLADDVGKLSCWDIKLWKTDIVDILTFPNWIALVSSLLVKICTENEVQQSIFHLCARACVLEPNFACTLFPALVYKLLSRDAPNAEEDYVEFDTFIGSSESDTNKKLSECFGTLLSHYAPTDSKEDIIKDKSQDVQAAIELIINVLDLLRRQTQTNFMMSQLHSRNMQPTATTSESYDESHSTRGDEAVALELTSVSACVPFGTVLRIDGLTLCRACIDVGRFATALFYIELYGEKKFAGSTRAQKLVEIDRSQLQSMPGDISGFEKAPESLPLAYPVDSLVSFFNSMRDIFHGIGDSHGSKAASSILIDVTGERNLLSADIVHESQHLNTLHTFDMYASTGTSPIQSHQAIIDYLDRSGLHSMIRTYTRGLMREHSVEFTSNDLVFVREKVFENGFHNMLWDDIPLSCLSVDERNALNVLGPRQSIGYFEAMHDIFEHTNFAKPISPSLSINAVSTLCDFISTKLLNEAATLDLSVILDRCKALYIVDKLCTTIPNQLASSCSSDSVSVENGKVCLDWRDNYGQTKTKLSFSQTICEAVIKKAIAALDSTVQDESEAKKLLINHIWDQCQEDTYLRRYNEADSALKRLKLLLKSCDPSDLDDSLWSVVSLKEASLLEAQGETLDAVFLAKRLIRSLPVSTNSLALRNTRAMSLSFCGQWMQKHKLEPSQTVHDDYLKPGAELAVEIHSSKRTKNSALRASSLLIAQSDLAYKLLEVVHTRISGPEWREQTTHLNELENELKECKLLVREVAERYDRSRRQNRAGSKELTDIENEFKEVRLYEINLSRDVESRNTERSNILQTLQKYRIIVFKTIGDAMSISGSTEGSLAFQYIYRFLQTWFAGLTAQDMSNEFLDSVDAAVNKIPSFHFVQVYDQLLSRLVKPTTPVEKRFQKTLRVLLERVCAAHPYHCIIQLITVSNGKNVGSGVGGRYANAFLENFDQSRVDTVVSILGSLQKSDNIGPLVESYLSLCNAYNFTALADTTKFHRGNTKNIPFSQLSNNAGERLDRCLGIGSRRRSHLPCIVTRMPPVRVDGDYLDTDNELIGSERLMGFESVFNITEGGLHRPKIVTCLGSKGNTVRELVKGEDEVRQDSVMQQVFKLLNQLLRNNFGSQTSLTRKNALYVWTYNVIPLSPASGVIEWVDETIAFGDCICDKGSRNSKLELGTHSKYFPGEWGNSYCRQVLSVAKPEEKKEAFQNIYDNFSPSFRFFFIEKFSNNLLEWYQAKMRYTKSVAVNSIVGHILGIGDRHSSNILVHNKRGDVIHIDFGIVFEQGKLLQVPEIVPFRMTRNTVDGFGPLGTQGAFTAAAEDTLEALRQHSDAILTILSAIAADPLYSWSISPVKARQRQQEEQQRQLLQSSDLSSRKSSKRRYSNGDGEPANAAASSKTNEAAALAIAKIQEKLKGYENGTSGEQQSVTGQVQLLLNVAKNPDNLCMMFPGWGPWV